MAIYSSRKASPTAIAAATFAQYAAQEFALPGAAAPIPLSEADEARDAADRGWIDCRSFSLVHVSATAAGADVTVTAQIKTSEGAPPIALALTDGELDADTSEVVLDDVIKAGFIRFLAAGTAGEGNTLSLYVLLK